MAIWTTIDAATVANGCLQVIPGSHHSGVINPLHHSAFLDAEQTAEHVSSERIVLLELAAGEVVLLHNWLLHASDVNRTSTSRRAFSVCYMDAATQTRGGQQFPVVFGAQYESAISSA